MCSLSVFQLLKTFLHQARKAYTTTASYLQKKLPLASQTLRALSALHPLLRGHSQAVVQLKKLGGLMEHLLPVDQDLHKELTLYTTDLSLSSFKEGESMVDWWCQVFEKGEKYPALGTLVRCALSIFHGPTVESSFSMMNEIIDSRSGKMTIQTVKYTLLSREKTAIEMFRRDDVKYGVHTLKISSTCDTLKVIPSTLLLPPTCCCCPPLLFSTSEKVRGDRRLRNVYMMDCQEIIIA